MVGDIELTFLTSTFFRRTLLVLLPFTALVTYVYSELVVTSMKVAENRTVQEYLRSEYSQFEERYAESKSGPLPSTEYLDTWWADDTNLPESLAELPPGIHELRRGRHLLVAEPAGSNRRVYFVLKEPVRGSGRMILSQMESTIYFAAAAVFVAGGLLAVLIARLLSGPIHALADDVGSRRTPGKRMRGHDRNDEIGVLSRAMERLINRMDAALSREKAVVRYASHDMRTPVSVIRIASSVLNMPECDDDKRNRNLQRIDDACADIEDLIEVHLCLAREGAMLPEETVSIRTLVMDELEKHAHTIKARKLTTSVVGLDQSISVARPMLKVVLGNLIRNAVSYSGQSILVSIDADGIVVENSSDADAAQINTDGLGLEIVERVCARLGWTLSAIQQDDVFVTQVQFTK